MDVSPQLIREIEFREQWRGYSPDEVDDFLERLAVAVEELQERLRQLPERAESAPATADDELRRTLVLAQRTADAAVAEAREEATRLVADAEERARRLIAEAQAEATRREREAATRVGQELGELSERRAALEADVEILTSYVEQHRGRLRDDLREQLEWLENAAHLRLPPPPALSSTPVPAAPRPPEPVEEPVEGPPEAQRPSEEPEATGLYDALADADADAGADEPIEAASVGPADEHDDDPFLTELRRAVTDTEPLGPRDRHEPHDDIDLTGADADDTGELTPSSRLRRRRRR